MTAVGSAMCSQTSLTTGTSLEIRPAGSYESIIHNLYVPDGYNVELYRSNGSVDILLTTLTGSWFAYYWHCTNGSFLKLKNVSGSTISVGYDGIYTVV